MHCTIIYYIIPSFWATQLHNEQRKWLSWQQLTFHSISAFYPLYHSRSFLNIASHNSYFCVLECFVCIDHHTTTTIHIHSYHHTPPSHSLIHSPHNHTISVLQWESERERKESGEGRERERERSGVGNAYPSPSECESSMTNTNQSGAWHSWSLSLVTVTKVFTECWESLAKSANSRSR